MRILFVTFLISLIAGPLDASAQRILQNLEIGLGPGVYIYQGDLSPSRVGSFRNPAPGINLWAAKPIKKDLSLRVGLTVAGLRGDESKYREPEYRQQRNLKFSASMVELGAAAVFTPETFPGKFSPYLFAGGALSLIRIVRDPSGMDPAFFAGDGHTAENLAADMARPTPRILPVVPVGAGVRYSISSSWSAYAENSFRITSTDYLDGFSKVANPERKDNYHSTNIGLIYSFGKKSKEGCPVVNL